MGYSARQLFSKARGLPHVPEGWSGTDDVISHLGTSVMQSFEGHSVKLVLLNNPSHLEAVDPVAVGNVRAKLDRTGDPQHAMCMMLHGDAAFAGQGVVPETFQMSCLPMYEVGGTVHLIVNNQLGFTTAPDLGRTSAYSSDISKMVEAPVLRVNGEHPIKVAIACQLAMEYRNRFRKDVVVDLMVYRRFGHNEVDEYVGQWNT